MTVEGSEITGGVVVRSDDGQYQCLPARAV